MKSAEAPKPRAVRLKREAEALRENLAKRKQQTRLRQNENVKEKVVSNE